MTIALTASLVARGRIDAEHAARQYARYYQPERGYGGAAHGVLQALREGADYRRTGRQQYPEGSFGNGGAMRIAPVGLAYRHASERTLYYAVKEALVCSHIHREAIDGAFLQASVVAIAANTQDPARFAPQETLQELIDKAQTDRLRRRLQRIGDALRRDDGDEEVIAKVGNGVRAVEAVAAALWAFLRYGGEPEECIVRAVGLGGDTDTIAAMAGAAAGALHGDQWIPRNWFDNIENGRHGRDKIIELGRNLAALDLID
jgi:poly(ADP-ribose) glycohydrolase ARH3